VPSRKGHGCSTWPPWARAPITRRSSRNRSRSFGLNEHVTIGFVELDDHSRHARVVVTLSPPEEAKLPSEGVPTVLMEAMAQGAAVLAARQPGIEEVVGDVGTLVDDPSPEGWADASGPCFEDAALAAWVG
jgi:glycosyltransferase involved in cell wall biosynthesis